jgi:hypothetical protein
MNSHDLRNIILEELTRGRHVRKQKLSLVDYLNESSERHLLEISDDTIISTGMSLHDVNEGSDNPDPFDLPDSPPPPTPTPKSAPAPAKKKRSGSPKPASKATPTPSPTAAPEADVDVASNDDASPGMDSTVMDAGATVDDADSFESGQAPPADGLNSEDPASSIMNAIIARAQAEDATRRSSGPTSGEAEKNTVIPPGTEQAAVQPVEPPKVDPVVNSSDKKSISRYLDKVARGEIEVKLTESKKTFKVQR